MNTIYGSKSEHAKALAVLVARRMSGELTHEELLAEMLSLDAQFPGCGWREAAEELTRKRLEDAEASERMARLRA